MSACAQAKRMPRGAQPQQRPRRRHDMCRWHSPALAPHSQSQAQRGHRGAAAAQPGAPRRGLRPRRRPRPRSSRCPRTWRSCSTWWARSARAPTASCTWPSRASRGPACWRSRRSSPARRARLAPRASPTTAGASLCALPAGGQDARSSNACLGPHRKSQLVRPACWTTQMSKPG